MKYITLLLCLCIVFAAAPDLAAQQGGYKIVVHPSTPGSSVGKTELKRIFLKQRTKWSSGEKAQPVDQKNGDVRAAFSQEILRKDLAAVDSYWQGQVFAAKSTPPAELSGDRDVVDFVRANPGSVGYVSQGANTQGVKVLSVAD